MYKKLGLEVHSRVFTISSFLIILFIFLTLLNPTSSKETLSVLKSWTLSNFDWFFTLSTNIILVFMFYLLFSKFGKIKLGGDDAKTDFSTISWLSMLFSAGMGIGLIYYGVSEPISHYTGWWYTPLNVEANTPAAYDMAFAAVMYEWGFHVWALYGLVGLSLGFFAFNKKLPLSIRSIFYPILKDDIYGYKGDIIDILAIITTLFGLATTLGLGAQQISSGLNFLFHIKSSVGLQILIIAIVTIAATISVVRGLDNGIKILSNITISVAILLLLFVIFTSSYDSFLASYLNIFTSYISNIVPLSNFINRADTDWYHGWSIFYWAWWIAWSPFVGMFIARISKGRTIREFIGAILFIPTFAILIWMGTFGTLGIEQVQNNIGQLAGGITDISLTTFQLLENLPFSFFTSLVALFLIIVFFVTSSDSGSLVVDTIASGGELNPPKRQRIFWALLEGMVAICLLYVGGKEALSALQAGSLVTALPFTFVLIFMMFNLYKGLSENFTQTTFKP